MFLECELNVVFSLTDSSKYCACVDGGGEGVQTTLKTDETILT